jgi:hypothetical protein
MAHSCMHCGELRITMEACVHRMLYCSAVQSSVDEFRSGLWLKLNWEAPMIGLGVFYSVPEWNADKTRVDKVRYWTQSHACSVESICGRSHGGGRIYGGGWIWSARIPSQHTNVDALQVLSRSQVTPGVVNVHADTADM